MIDGCRLMNSWRGINKPCCYSTHDYASQSSVSVSNSYLRAPQIFMVLEAGLISAAELWKRRLTEGEHIFFMPMCVPLMQSIMHIIHTCMYNYSNYLHASSPMSFSCCSFICLTLSSSFFDLANRVFRDRSSISVRNARCFDLREYMLVCCSAYRL